MARKKARSRRRVYTKEIKRKAVEMANQPGITVAEVAEQLDVSPQQLSQWRSKFGREDDSAEAQKKLDALEENRRLKEQLRQAKQEIEILKKAASYFASQK